MPRFGNVEYEKRDNVVVMTMDEPQKLNALTPGIREGITTSLDEMEKDDDARIGIITNNGRAFCAGFDIATIHRTNFNPVIFKRLLRDEFFEPMARRMEKYPKPLIAAVGGLAFGGGLELAILCDIIIASDKAQFGVPEINIGILPGYAIVRLHKIIGGAKAKEMTWTGDPISAEEAYRINLISKIVPHEKLMEEAMALASKIASKPAIAVQLGKSAYNREISGDELTYTEDAYPLLMATEDAKEGISAFMEKRKAVFHGR